MRIIPKAKTASEKKLINSELKNIAGEKELKPPVCDPTCSYYKTQPCDYSCPKACKLLSSDPGHPIEPGIVPLVYELKRLGVFDPCWSCEGHNGPDGKLWKSPSVWFYAETIVHLRVVDEVVQNLFNNGQLTTPWEIALTHSDRDNPDTCFSLHPRIDNENHTLSDLQNDAVKIAEKLRRRVTLQANQLAAEIEKSP